MKNFNNVNYADCKNIITELEKVIKKHSFSDEEQFKNIQWHSYFESFVASLMVSNEKLYNEITRRLESESLKNK